MIYFCYIKIEKCLMKCCANHGIPNQCLEEIDDTRSVSKINETHKIVTIVHSHQCLQYRTIMNECKKDCIQDILTGSKQLENVLYDIRPLKSSEIKFKMISVYLSHYEN